MKFDFNDMYRYLLSHTFPGLLLLAELIIFWEKTHNLATLYFIDYVKQQPTTIILLAYAFSTLLGTILDASQHFAFDVFYEKFCPVFIKNAVEDNNSINKYLSMKDSNRVQVYQHFLEDDLWYPYECYANTFIAMVLGIFLLWAWLLAMPIKLKILFFTGLLFLFFEALYTFREFCKNEEYFDKSFSNMPIKNANGENNAPN